MKLLIRIALGLLLFIFSLKGLKTDITSGFYWVMLFGGLVILFYKPLSAKSSSSTFVGGGGDSGGGSGGDCGGDGGGCD